ncbi:MAG: hypothetical protein HY343_01440 [Lentisphaerae bacterium]|nr:hypothetical protein [Lentisphaerota bacterium]
MRKLYFVVMLYACGFAFANAAEQQDKYTALIMPDNVTLGMTREVLQPVRPEARKLDLAFGSRNTNALVLTEMKDDSVPLTCHQYHFLDGQLRAVTKVVHRLSKQGEEMGKQIHDALEKELVKKADEKIIRGNGNMQPILVGAELWTHEKSGTCVYFVTGAKDATIIVFDPKYFGKKDFFMSSEDMPEIAPLFEKARKTIKASQKQKNKPSENLDP